MKMFRNAMSALAIVGALGLMSAAKADTIIYDNGAPNQANGNEMTEWIQSEDFSLLSAASITGIKFWTVEQAGGYAGSIYYSINSDSAGTPGSSLASGTIAPVSRTSTGNSLFFGDEFEYVLSITQLNLGAGMYHLLLHNGSLAGDVRSEVYWETTNGNATQTGLEDQTPFGTGSWVNNGQEHAFQLLGGGTQQEVPEPGAMAMMFGAGVVGLVLVRRRK
jgi:hypothetical protein